MKFTASLVTKGPKAHRVTSFSLALRGFLRRLGNRK